MTDSVPPKPSSVKDSKAVLLAQATTADAVPRAAPVKGSNVFRLGIARTELQSVQVVDTDFVLMLKNGRRVILPDAALQSMLDPEYTLVFTDSELSGASVLQNSGRLAVDGISTTSVGRTPDLEPLPSGTSSSSAPNTYSAGKGGLGPITNDPGLATSTTPPPSPKSSGVFSFLDGVPPSVGALGALGLLGAGGGGGGGGSSGTGTGTGTGSGTGTGTGTSTGSDTGTDSATKTQSGYDVSVQVMFGQVTAKLNYAVYNDKGTLIKSGTTDNQGYVSFTIANGYTGALLVKVSDANGDPINGIGGTDYLDESTGKSKDMSDASMRAISYADGTTGINITVTPLTELATRLVVDSDTPNKPPTSKSTIASANQTVSQAFGVDDVVGTSPVAVTDSGFASAPTASKGYGLALAALSGLDQTNNGSTDKTISQLLALYDGSSFTAKDVAAAMASGMTVAAPQVLEKVAQNQFGKSYAALSVAQQSAVASLTVDILAANIAATQNADAGDAVQPLAVLSSSSPLLPWEGQSLRLAFTNTPTRAPAVTDFEIGVGLVSVTTTGTGANAVTTLKTTYTWAPALATGATTSNWLSAPTLLSAANNTYSLWLTPSADMVGKVVAVRLKSSVSGTFGSANELSLTLAGTATLNANSDSSNGADAAYAIDGITNFNATHSNNQPVYDITAQPGLGNNRVVLVLAGRAYAASWVSGTLYRATITDALADNTTYTPKVRVYGLGGYSGDLNAATDTWVERSAQSLTIDTTPPPAPQARLLDGAHTSVTNNAALAVPTEVETGAFLQYRILKGARVDNGTPVNAVAGVAYRALSRTGADGDGWSNTYIKPTGVDGDDAYVVQVRQVDKAGNKGVALANVGFQLDTQVSTPQMTLAEDTGVSFDNITANPLVNVTGLETLATWQWTRIDGTGGPDLNTVWTMGTGTSFNLLPGTGTYYVRQTDAAGNVSTAWSPTSAGAAVQWTYAQTPTKPNLRMDDTGNALSASLSDGYTKSLNLQWPASGSNRDADSDSAYTGDADGGPNTLVYLEYQLWKNATLGVNGRVLSSQTSPDVGWTSVNPLTSAQVNVDGDYVIEVRQTRRIVSGGQTISYLSGEAQALAFHYDRSAPATPDVALANDTSDGKNSPPDNHNSDTITSDPALTLPSNTEPALAGGRAAGQVYYRVWKDAVIDTSGVLGNASGKTRQALGLGASASAGRTVDADGWGTSYVAPTVGEGDASYVVEVRQMDSAGNVSGSRFVAFQLDRTAPVTPNSPSLQTDSSNGRSDVALGNDGITNDAALVTLTAEAGASLQYRVWKGAKLDVNGALLDRNGNTISDANKGVASWLQDGTLSYDNGWSFSYTRPTAITGGDDSYVVEVRQIDAAGNLSATPNKRVTFTLDTTVDTPNRLALDASTDSGTLGPIGPAGAWVAIAATNNNADGITSVTSPKLSGQTEPYASVRMTFKLGGVTGPDYTVGGNLKSWTTHAAADGTFQFSLPSADALPDGTYVPVLQVTDRAGNVKTFDSTTASGFKPFTVDATAPLMAYDSARVFTNGVNLKDAQASFVNLFDTSVANLALTEGSGITRLVIGYNIADLSTSRDYLLRIGGTEISLVGNTSALGAIPVAGRPWRWEYTPDGDNRFSTGIVTLVPVDANSATPVAASADDARNLISGLLIKAPSGAVANANNQFTYTITDAAGNVGTSVQNLVFLDGSPTAWINAITGISNDSGVVTANSPNALSDQVTSVQTQNVRGTYIGALAKGQQIQVSVDGGVNWQRAIVTGTNTWLAQGLILPSPNAGANNAQVSILTRVVDSSGKTGTPINPADTGSAVTQAQMLVVYQPSLSGVTATLSSLTDNTQTTSSDFGGVLVNGMSSNELRPVLTGSLSSSGSGLASDQVLQILDNGLVIANLLPSQVTTANWTYTPTADLSAGGHSFSVRVAQTGSGAVSATSATIGYSALNVVSPSVQAVSGTLAVNGTRGFRYILVKQNGTLNELLYLNEVQVMVNGVNVALNKAATAGPYSTFSGFPASAVTNGDVTSRNGYASDQTSTDNWVQIDLGQTYPTIDAVVLTPLSSTVGGANAIRDLTRFSQLDVFASPENLSNLTYTQLRNNAAAWWVGTTGAAVSPGSTPLSMSFNARLTPVTDVRADIAGTLTAPLGAGDRLSLWNGSTDITNTGTFLVTGTSWRFRPGVDWSANGALNLSIRISNTTGTTTYAVASTSLLLNVISATAPTSSSSPPIAADAVGISTSGLVTDFSGSVSNTATINDSRPVLSGTLTMGAGLTGLPISQQVWVYDNGAYLGAATVSGSTWSYQPVTALPNGSHRITARVVNAASGTSSESASLNLNLAQIAPPSALAGSYNSGPEPVRYVMLVLPRNSAWDPAELQVFSNGVNVALNKTVTLGSQGSHASDGGGGPALVDGNTATYYHNNYAQTLPAYQWLEVDLGAWYAVSSIVLTARSTYGARQNGVQLFVSGNSIMAGLGLARGGTMTATLYNNLPPQVAVYGVLGGAAVKSVGTFAFDGTNLANTWSADMAPSVVITNKSTPIAGVLSAPLAVGETIKVFNGASEVAGTLSLNGTQWSFVPSQPWWGSDASSSLGLKIRVVGQPANTAGTTLQEQPLQLSWASAIHPAGKAVSGLTVTDNTSALVTTQAYNGTSFPAATDSFDATGPVTSGQSMNERRPVLSGTLSSVVPNGSFDTNGSWNATPSNSLTPWYDATNRRWVFHATTTGVAVSTTTAGGFLTTSTSFQTVPGATYAITFSMGSSVANAAASLLVEALDGAAADASIASLTSSASATTASTSVFTFTAVSAQTKLRFTNTVASANATLWLDDVTQGLTATQAVRIEDGGSVLGYATVTTNGGAWSFTPSADLAPGAHTLTARLVNMVNGLSSGLAADTRSLSFIEQGLSAIALSSTTASGANVSGQRATARYILLRRDVANADWFDMGEVEVMSGGVNVALGKAVVLGAQGGSNGAALVDGIYGTGSANVYFASSAQTTAWVQIDLGAPFSIDGVRVTPRYNLSSRLNGTLVYGSMQAIETTAGSTSWTATDMAAGVNGAVLLGQLPSSITSNSPMTIPTWRLLNTGTQTLTGTLAAPLGVGESLDILVDGTSVGGNGTLTVQGTRWTFVPATNLATGLRTVTVLIQNSTGAKLMSTVLGVNVVAANPVGTALTLKVYDDVGAASLTYGQSRQNTDLLAGTNRAISTDDSQPTLYGTLSAPLAVGQVLRIYDQLNSAGNWQLLPASPNVSVSGGNISWSYTPSTPLASGAHQLRVVVEDLATGVTGTPVTVALNVVTQINVSVTASSGTGLVTGRISNGSVIGDVSPTVSITLDAPLADGERVGVYDNGVLLGRATVVAGSNNRQFSFSMPSALAAGGHALVAQIEAEQLVNGTPSATPTSTPFDGRAVSSPALFTVTAKAPLTQTIVFSGANDDVANNGSTTGAVPSGGSTDDTTPSLWGTLGSLTSDVRLGIGQRVQVLATQANGTTQTLPGYANINGQIWTYDVPSTSALSNGAWTFRAQVIDAGTGTLGNATGSFSLTVRSGPTLDGVSLAGGQAQSTGPAQWAAVNGALTVSGGLSTPLDVTRESVAVFADGGQYLGTAQVNDLQWTFTLPSSLSVGTHTLRAQVVGNDAISLSNAGFTQGRAVSPLQTVIVDGTAPTATAIVANARDAVGGITGHIPNGGWSDDARPWLAGTISGPLSINQTVQLFDGASSVPLTGTLTMVTAYDWNFRPNSALSAGAHSLTAKVVNLASGAASAASAPYAINTQSLTWVSVRDDTGLLQGNLLSGTAAITEDTTPQISVKLAQVLGMGQKVNFYDNGLLLGSGVSDPSDATGTTYSFTPALSQGTHTLYARIEAADNTGLMRSDALTVRVQPDDPMMAILSNVGNSNYILNVADSNRTIDLTTLVGQSTSGHLRGVNLGGSNAALKVNAAALNQLTFTDNLNGALDWFSGASTDVINNRIKAGTKALQVDGAAGNVVAFDSTANWTLFTGPIAHGSDNYNVYTQTINNQDLMLLLNTKLSTQVL